MSSYYTVLRRGLKWYRKVAMELIFGAAMTNAWLLYNQKTEQQKLSFLKFKELLITSLITDDREDGDQVPKRRR